MSSGYASRSNSGRAEDEAFYRSPERREKTKSVQQPRHVPLPERGILKNLEPDHRNRPPPQRPSLQGRTISAPFLNRDGQLANGLGTTRRQPYEDDTRNKSFAQQVAGGTIDYGKDEDEIAGIGATRHLEPLRSPRSEDKLPEINIAILGADGVGKSTFVQKALDLPYPPPSARVERRLTWDSVVYLVRFLEIPIEDVDIDEDDDTISWPETIERRMTPRVHGALTLYDVKDKSSLDHVPEVLTGLSKACLPSVLVSCKCDVAPLERDLDPVAIEEKAKRSVRNLATLQTSNATSDNHKRAISMIFQAIVSLAEGDGIMASRRRAQTAAVRGVSPQPALSKGHARASSEYNLGALRDRYHGRHDSSLASYGLNNRTKAPRQMTEDGMQRSFLFEESGTESSTEGSVSSSPGDSRGPAFAPPLPVSALSENGASFSELVDRLLAQPLSKADSKFSAIFLALYRKFSAPGRLLEAIVERFDALGRSNSPEATKTAAQLRCLAIIEQWMSHYPGDFAFPKTKRRMQTLVAKMAAVPMFSVAANETAADLESVQEDDDTNWAYNDQDREVYDTVAAERWTMSSTASTLLDDATYSLLENMSGLSVTDDVGLAATLTADTLRSTSGSSSTSSQIMAAVEAAQRQAQSLEPRPRLTLSKVEWRKLMDVPDDVIAKELTRMDWAMFLSIRPRDIVRHVSLAGPEKSECKSLVNVTRTIEHFNMLAAWVANFVLFRDKPKHRALMLEKIMRVARKLREMNNYNALGAIIAGVKSSAVHRLQATRDLIPPAVGKDWMKLEILMSPSRSHAAYRLAWENSSSERIPYIPLHCRDLVSAEQGNKTFIGQEEDGRINWKKFEIMGEVMVGIQRAQGSPYRGLEGWKGGDQVRELVLDVHLVKDEEELYERSIQCEAAAGSSGTTSARFKEFFKR